MRSHPGALVRFSPILMASLFLSHQAQHQQFLIARHRPHYPHHHQERQCTTLSSPLPRSICRQISIRFSSSNCANPEARGVSQPYHRSNHFSSAISASVSAGVMASGKRGEVKVFDSVEDLALSLAHYVAELSDAAIKERGAFSVVLSGGSLISTMAKLCEPPFLKSIDWSKWHVFWADERVVPRNDPESNYKLANDGLLSKVPIVPGHVYSINDALPAESAADDYEFGLRQLVKTRIVGVCPSSDCPRFDLILLGMGPDGHVASLFPGHPLTHEKEKWITFITDSPKPPPERITFTFPVINAAANVAMVLTGANKADVLVKAFGEELPPGALPVQMVSPREGKLVWFLDKHAASKL